MSTIITKRQYPNYHKYEMELAGRPLTLEVGKLAELANAAVMDIISAIATGSAAAAIGIVRVSGAGCFALCDRVFLPAGGSPLSGSPPRTMAILVLICVTLGICFNTTLDVLSALNVPLFAFLTFANSLGGGFREMGRVFLKPAPVVVTLLLLHDALWHQDGQHHGEDDESGALHHRVEDRASE